MAPSLKAGTGAVLLIHPPVAKTSEPPAGIARLAGALSSHGIPHTVLDANIEGLLSLLGASSAPVFGDSRWTERAFRKLDRHISDIRSLGLYSNHARYTSAIKDLNRVLACQSRHGRRVGLADYDDAELSPIRSQDLIASAEQCEQNPFFSYFRERLDALCSEQHPSVVGFSLNYLSQALCTFAMVGYVRKVLPQARVVLGGGLVTTWVRKGLQENAFAGLVDDLVAGPGETRLLSILGRPDEENVLVRPRYTHLPRELYLSPGFVLPYSGSSGCSWKRCEFCPETAENNPYRAMPISKVLSDLGVLVGATGPSLIHLLDNAVSPSLLSALSAHPPGAPWYGFARAGDHLADPDYCHALRTAGCVMLKLGIESGDQGVLDRLGKGISLETASKALANLTAAGIATYVYLLFGTPAEDEEAARKTLDFTVRHREDISFLNLALFNLPRCSAAADRLATRDFSAGDLSLYADFIHPAGWDRRRVRRFLSREFTAEPAIASILRADPPVFTSNHAPFFARTRSGPAGRRRPAGSDQKEGIQ